MQRFRQRHMLLPTDRYYSAPHGLLLSFERSHSLPWAGNRASISVLPDALCFITISLQKLGGSSVAVDISAAFYVEHKTVVAVVIQNMTVSKMKNTKHVGK